MQVKAIIVEDELRSREFLNNLVKEYCPGVQVLAMAATVDEAIQAINTHKPELVFLDIELHTGTGFDVLESVEDTNFHVIFTTAYDH